MAFVKRPWESKMRDQVDSQPSQVFVRVGSFPIAGISSFDKLGGLVPGGVITVGVARVCQDRLAGR